MQPLMPGMCNGFFSHSISPLCLALTYIYSGCCELDSRVLYLDGFDAGIIIEQSQSTHNGPLRSQAGDSSQPILAVPYLNQGKGYDGSMLAWVCWDEFVNLKSPY